MSGFFIIKTQLPSLNEYINICRANKYSGAKFKKDIEFYIELCIQQAKRNGTLSEMGNVPCEVFITWNEKNRKRDVDNIQNGAKYIMDALQTCGIIKNDSQKYVSQIHHHVQCVDKTDYVKVELREIGNNKVIYDGDFLRWLK